MKRSFKLKLGVLGWIGVVSSAVFGCPAEYPLQFSEIHACGKLRVIIPANSYGASFNASSKTLKNITVTDPNIDRGNTPVRVALKLVDDGLVIHEVLTERVIGKVHFKNFMNQLCGVNRGECGSSANYTEFANEEFVGTLYFARKSLMPAGPGDWNIEITVQRTGYQNQATVKDEDYKNI